MKLDGIIAFVTVALTGEVVTFEKLLPGDVDRRWIFLVILIELIEVSYVRIRYI